MDAAAVTPAKPQDQNGSPGLGISPQWERIRPAQSVRPRILVPAVLSGVLLWACYFPLAWGWLAWLALVPLLSLVRSEARPGRIYAAAWLAGLLFFWAAIQWMRVADYRMYYTWAMLATYCSLYVPLAIWLIRVFDRNTPLPLTLSVPLVWSGLEFLRSFFMTGFAWYFLGHTQHAYLPVIQISDLGGAYTVSFLVGTVNGLIFEICFRQASLRALVGLRSTSRPRPLSLGLQAAVVLALFAGSLAYGFWRLDQDTMSAGPRVALLQGSVDQRLRNEASKGSSGAASELIRRYGNLCKEAAEAQPRPDLIVWPETSFPAEWREYPDGEPLPGSRGFITSVGPYSRSNVLLGLNAEIVSRTGAAVQRYCSALLVRPDGSIGGRYDKMHRVPFGEYVPLRDVLPFMNDFAPYDFDYSILPGKHFTRFFVGDYRFGTLICFEDTDPYLARQYVGDRDGPPVHFLLNISNDGWFDGSSEHDEHLAICRFRAIETRRAVARAVNMGISAVIDSNGRVLAPSKAGIGEKAEIWIISRASGETSLPISQWHEFKKTSGVLMAIMPIDHRSSLYALWGDWLGWGCLIVTALGLAYSAVQRFRGQRHVASA